MRSPRNRPRSRRPAHLRGPRLLASLALVAPLALGACSSHPSSEKLVVFAAASLVKAFPAIAQGFEKDHPGVSVTFSFDGSSDLVDQLAGGAGADVLATADQTTMARAVSQKLVTGSPTVFATNVLILITPPDNPGHVTGLNSSLRGKRLVVCAPQVPCGAATLRLAKLDDVTLEPISQTTKVTDVVGAVTTGEADAGVVYTTDASNAGSQVHTIAIPRSSQVVNSYPITTVAGSTHAADARAFVAYVTSPAGRKVLASYGFGAP
ncbi:MAG TPA: molybdate ABC transporter substrate-binding protein [Propionibacteriaceae bacterium]|nr:molybdate ABC transporter substrate-binding protein [Propionibacteriaceae bacterium]